VTRDSFAQNLSEREKQKKEKQVRFGRTLPSPVPVGDVYFRHYLMIESTTKEKSEELVSQSPSQSHAPRAKDVVTTGR